jgi:uncharacterized RDD family membrane protein YckC
LASERVACRHPDGVTTGAHTASSVTVVASLPERIAQPVAERVVALVVDALDVDDLVARVDLNAVLARVDIDSLLEGVDVDSLVARVDLDAVLARTDLATVVRSTLASTAGGAGKDALRTARHHLAAADAAIGGRSDRLLGREDPPPRPDAGAVSRLAAYLVDYATLTVMFSVGAVVAGFLVRLLTGRDLDPSANVSAGLALAVWWVAYFAVSWAVTGRTVGMGLAGVLVVRDDLEPVGAARSLVRTLAWPLSVLLAGLGFVGIVVHPRRRALHDLIAGTRVVHDAAMHDEAASAIPRLPDVPPVMVPVGPAPTRTG